MSLHKEIFKAIHRSQHCQRNWNLDSELSEDDIKLIIESATQCPSKQNKTFYKIHAVTNRKIIEEIHENTKGFGAYPTSSGKLEPQTNPQVLANLLLVFEAYVPSGVDQHPCEDYHFNIDAATLRDQQMAVGIAAGYVNITSSLLGYSTGCCLCFNPNKISEILNLDNTVLLLMGVGVKDNERNRREHHIDEDFVFPSIKKNIIPVNYID
jgi:nitroreductase